MKTKPTSSEYKAFENLLGRVLSVPKAEITRRIEEDKREKRTSRSASPAPAPMVPAPGLDQEQAANAVLIIAIGRELGVADRGIAIALGTAMARLTGVTSPAIAKLDCSAA